MIFHFTQEVVIFKMDKLYEWIVFELYKMDKLYEWIVFENAEILSK